MQSNMKVTVNSGVGGAWLDKKSLKNGDVIKIVTEAKETVSQQGNTQLVAKVLVRGGETEAKNVAINKPSMTALVDAFGDDTVDWVNKHLSVHIEKTLIGGQRGYALYLLPEGFEVTEDDGGYLVVQRIGVSAPAKEESADDDINPADIPF